MDIKSSQCPVVLTLEEWTVILRSLDNSPSSNQLRLKIESYIRDHVNWCYEEEKKATLQKVFSCEEEDTQEIPIVRREEAAIDRRPFPPEDTATTDEFFLLGQSSLDD